MWTLSSHSYVGSTELESEDCVLHFPEISATHGFEYLHSLPLKKKMHPLILGLYTV